jgi:hypothetical protein
MTISTHIGQSGIAAARLLRAGAPWAVLAAVALGASACTTITPVQAWEKGILAKPEMRFDAAPGSQIFTEHVYASREGASGGTGAAGGGCGCY